MRNLFDQYDKPENKLTHALVCTLQRDRKLIRRFLKWLKISKIPPLKEIQVVEQQVPGEAKSRTENESDGVPDTWFFDNDGWAVLVESKVDAGIDPDQLKRHAETAERRDYKNPEVVLISVDKPEKLPKYVRHVEWREVYAWFNRPKNPAIWTRIFVDYMRVFESKMNAKKNKIRGTITMFDGIYFNKDEGKDQYDYGRAKALLKLFRSELQKCKGLDKLGVKRDAAGRGAITGSNQDHVWDYLPLKAASSASNFTNFPHLTIALSRDYATAAIVVPNSIKGDFFRKLKHEENGFAEFKSLILTIEKQLRPIVNKTGAKPTIHLLQRHYDSRRRPPNDDATLKADLRTLVEVSASKSKVKYQPGWLEMIYEVWVHKKSNIQLAVEVQFPYECKGIRSSKATELYVEAWDAMSPLLDFVLDRN